MNKFDKLFESLTTIKTTKVIRYPKQIQLSEEFLKSLKAEVLRHNILDESQEPIRDFEEKFLKALRFHIKEHCGHCHKMKRKRKKGPMISAQSNPGGIVGSSKVAGGL